ncbi:MAG: RidA family protein [Planctomycetota bacterium]|nr:RidA family protein [Planctomycetota bacterium]MDA1214737.1 RidA family protein [Planctomycetota bacterium]
MTTLITHPTGRYKFLPGIEPYSCGVIAEPGYEIVHVLLKDYRPWRTGFEFVDSFLKEQGRERTDLCAMQLRSAKPFTISGFIAYNKKYCEVLQKWGVYAGEFNPIARTNVCPVGLDDPEPVLHAFSFVRPNAKIDRKTFIVAGAGEMNRRELVSEGIIRIGETSYDAMAEKAAYVCSVMEKRLFGLQAEWEDVTTVEVYTIHPMYHLIEPLLLPTIPASSRRGILWHYTRPPVEGIEYEMDLRGVATEWVV